MKFKCKGCGYIADNEAPDICPKCGAKKEMFEELSEEVSNLIDTSRCTNYIHMELIEHMNSVLALSEGGIEENLDPNCVKLFQYAQEQAEIIKQMAKAEIVAHIGKGKWG